jgi:predicted CopG family antitoxin
MEAPCGRIQTHGCSDLLEKNTCIMHIACMATKTISLKLEAYERLRRARRSPNESFSEVVMRAHWPEVGLTALELLAVYEAEGPHFSPEALDAIDEADATDKPPEEKWARP